MMLGRRFATVVLGLGALLAAAAATGALPPDHPAMKLLAKAKASIRDGKAAEAAGPLEEVKKLFPNTPEADEAERLIKRVGSHEVLIDRSHEWRGETHTISQYLRGAGIGVTISDASLEHLKDRLADFEVILIWQETAAVTFTDAELLMLKDYAKEGGRILVIGTTKPAAGYPLKRLLDAFACPLQGPAMQVNYGAGKLKFFENAGLFDEARLADARESRAEVVEVFQRLMPYEQVKPSGGEEYVAPERSEVVGAARLEYSARLAPGADRMRGLLQLILDQTTLAFKDDLAEGLVVRLLPRAYSGWTGGVTFSPGAFQAQPDAAREIARAVALYALFPAAKWITFPPWVSGAWCDFAALRILYRAGYKREADAWLKEYTDAWKDPSKALTDGLDLSVSRMAFARNWNAKAIWALEQLEQPRDRKSREPRNVLAGLRKALKRYAAAGRVGDSLSTRDVLFYLSQAFHEDMFAYFQSIGTTVLPVKLDYYELDKDEKK